ARVGSTFAIPQERRPHAALKKTMEPGRTLRVELTASTMFRVVLACAAVWLLFVIWPILLVIVVALMIAGALAPPAAWLERRGMRRGLAGAVVFSAVFLGFAAVA